MSVGFLDTTLKKFMNINGIRPEDMWEDDETYLWFARLYPVCSSQEEL